MLIPSISAMLSPRESKNSSGRSRQNTGRMSEDESGSFKRFKANLNKKNIDAMEGHAHWNMNIRWNDGKIMSKKKYFPITVICSCDEYI